MQRSRRRVFGNRDFFEAWIIRLQKTSTAARDSNSAWNQIGIARPDVAIAFNARDLARLLEAAQSLLKILLSIRGQMELPEQLWNIPWNVVSSSEKS